MTRKKLPDFNTTMDMLLYFMQREEMPMPSEVMMMQEGLKEEGHTYNYSEHGADGFFGRDTARDLMAVLEKKPSEIANLSTYMLGKLINNGQVDKLRELVKADSELHKHFKDEVNNMLKASPAHMMHPNDLRDFQAAAAVIGDYDGKVDGLYGQLSYQATLSYNMKAAFSGAVVSQPPTESPRLHALKLTFANVTDKIGDEILSAQNEDKVFDKAMALLFELEGGYADVEGDRGGRTFMGVTERFHPEEFDALMNIYKTHGLAAAGDYASDFELNIADSDIESLLDMFEDQGLEAAMAYAKNSGIDIEAKHLVGLMDEYKSSGMAAGRDYAKENVYRPHYWEPYVAHGMPTDAAVFMLVGGANFGSGRAADMLQQAGGDLAKAIDLSEAHYRNLADKDPTQKQFLQGWLNRTNTMRAILLDDASEAGGMLASNEAQYDTLKIS